MTLRRSLLALGALGSAASLTGCVAAVIPLAAGTLMASSGKIRGGAGTRPTTAMAPPVAPSALDTAAPDPGWIAAIVPGALPDPTARLAAQAGATESRSAELLPVPSRTSDGLTILRGPAPPPTSSSDRVVETFFTHALGQAQRNPIVTPRQSALLAEPGALRPERMACDRRPPAVIIDLDPGKESFDPLLPVAGNPRLAAALADLREHEVTVFWASHLGEGFEGALRSVLAQTGLDPLGQDRVLLLRTLDQRKHTRRTEIAQTHCVVAMLGDERADFDELFHYLKQPDTALRLDAMLGSGWFLANPIPAQTIGDE